MKNRNIILSVIGAVLCIASFILLFTGASLRLIPVIGQLPPNLTFTLLLMAGSFLLLKGLFPDRSSTWYLNHMKIVVSILFVILIVATLLTNF